jgi:HEAT repeat protein
VCGVLVVAAVGGLLWWAVAQPREPVYDGRSLSYWLRQRPPIPSVRPFTAKRLPQALLDDTNALPFLITALNGEGAWLHRTYLRIWLGIGPITRFVPEPVVPFIIRVNAARLLGHMGGAAKPATPALVRALRADDSGPVREFAGWALGECGEGDRTVVAALTEALGDGVWAVRDAATNALLKLDPEAAAKAGVSH